MNFGLKSRVVLVTGAAGNIGSAICRQLSQEQAIVIAADISPRPQQANVADWLHLDVTSEAGWAEVIATIAQRHGRLDVLVNNAGIAPMGTLEGTGYDEWRRCLAVNVDSVFLGMKAATPLLRETGAASAWFASVVNIASASSNRATAMASAYAASKAAVAQLTKAVGIEYLSLGYRVRANSVHPAAVQSDMIDQILQRYSVITGGTPVEDLRKAMIADHPMRRLVEPDEVARSVLFLASDASAYVNASEVHVDGGLTAN
ncbi:SDR family oxidoreductase [Hydrocarboniphaga sp.]|uniref:SDR family oxidoreductase n=1 Tax=Hydrocarboniphaga sp. TaxID=2033016 RepID=UPI003D106CAA